jgi:hypothetical protein
VATIAFNSPASSGLLPQSDIARETAVMAGHRLFTQMLAQPVTDALRHPPRIDEHQGTAMLGDLFGQPVINLIPLIVGTRTA